MIRTIVTITLLLFQQFPFPGGHSANGGGGGAPSFVNSWVTVTAACDSSTTCALTVSPVAGHSLCAFFVYRSDLSSITSIKDSSGASLVSIFSVTNIGTHYGHAMYCESSIASGITAVTATLSASNNSQLIVFEYSNASATTDGASNDSTLTCASGSCSGISITPGAGDKVAIFASIANSGSSQLTTCTAGTGFSNMKISGNTADGDVVCADFQGVSSASGSYTANTTYTPTIAGANANIGAVK